MSNLMKQDFTEEQIGLIKSTIARGATTDELKLFLHRCKIMDLDPLKPGQIHFVKYGNSPGTIVVGIEGFRSIAARTGKLSGIKRGALKDDKGKLIGGWAEVYRRDWTQPAREEAPLSEYNTGKAMWVKMPETMIKKVAECAALRMAFPDDLGGVYGAEEMDKAKDSDWVGKSEIEGNGIVGDIDAPRIKSGKYANQLYSDVDPEKLYGLVLLSEKKYEGVHWEKLPKGAQEFLSNAEPYIEQFRYLETDEEDETEKKAKIEEGR